MKKVFTEDLPKHVGGKGQLGNIGSINWKECIGYKVKGIYDDLEFEVEILDYALPHIHIKYLDKDPFKIATGSFLICELGRLLGKRTTDFKYEVGLTFKDEKRDITIIDREQRKKKTKEGYTNNEKWYKYKCNKCTYEDWTIEHSLVKGKGCACCCLSSKIIVEGLNDIPTTAPWMIPYFQGGYDEAKEFSKGTRKKIYPICPDCGRVKDKEMKICDIYSRHSIGCSCGDGFSYPEKLMFALLKLLNLEFQFQYTPDWIKPMRYDFYFKHDNKEYIVETDGGFHCTDNNMNGQTKEESEMIDDYKDDMADRYNIEMIRIDCEESELEYIKNKILNSKLNELFDLSGVNWLKCEEFALRNLVKLTCKYKKDNPNLSVVDICKLVRLSIGTVNSYLKKGTVLGWCHYDGKEERKKGRAKSIKSIEVFKDEVSLGVFVSIAELERQSKELYRVKLIGQCISLVCSGKRKKHKGFTFKYVI